MQVLQRVAPDVLARTIPHHQQLGRRHTTTTMTGRQQRLHPHGRECGRDLLADGGLSFVGKRVAHARERRRHIGRVQRRQHEVPGFPGGQRNAHRLGIAHLANHDDVGRLAERGSQRRRKVERIGANFHLLHDTSMVDVFVLDRIFDGDDVFRLTAIDGVDERGHRRGLAGARGAANDDQPALDLRQRLDARRQAQTHERRHTRRQRADDSRRTPPLAVQVDTETPHPLKPIRTFARRPVAIRALRVRRQRGQYQGLDVLAVERICGRTHDGAVDPERRRFSGEQQEVARLPRHHHVEPRVEASARTCALAVAELELVNQAVEVVESIHGNRSKR